MKLVGLCGYARTGKDSIYTAMSASDRAGWYRVAFADALKAELEPVVSAIKKKYPHVTKEQLRPLYVAHGKVMRSIDPLYWIKQAENAVMSIAYCDRNARICLTDLRYANEVAWVESLGGIVIRVMRPGIGPANDEEARSFAEIERDYPNTPVVLNDDVIERAASRVLDILEGTK